MSTSFIAGGGLKKPLNMLEAPVYADIKQQPPQFKWSGKHWQVDVGEIMKSTETETSLLGDSILTHSYRDNIDKYGQSSHQEKIVNVRLPLQNYYEDFGPLNRLPTKIYAIQPHINPTTVNDSGGTTAFAVNNTVIQDVDSYITDRISANSWFSTYYDPIDMPLDNAVLPDLVTTLPNRSVSSGYNTQRTIDAENIRDYSAKGCKDNITPISAHSGYSYNGLYDIPMASQTSNVVTRVDEYEGNPHTSAHSGYQAPHMFDGETRLDETFLDSKITVSGHAGYTPITVNGETRVSDIILERNLPYTPISSGHINNYMFDGENRYGDIQLIQHIDSKFQIVNPVSETGYQTRMESNNSVQDHIKLNKTSGICDNKTIFSYRSEKMLIQIAPLSSKESLPVKFMVLV
jgi:hypothetical protein